MQWTTTAAKSLQSCPTLCDPTESSPPGSPVPGILQARTLEWVAISFSNAWKWKMEYYSAIKRSKIWFICSNVDESGNCHANVIQKEKNKYILTHTHMYVYGILRNGTDEPICRAEIEMQM